MTNQLIQLWPQPATTVPLTNLYLAEKCAATHHPPPTPPFVYANFIQSLDGRIATADKTELSPPKEILNPRDWRLFQELAVQADIVLTTGRYLRDYANGRAQEILRIYDDPNLADLKDWRQQQNKPTYPALAIISASLDFSIPATLTKNDRSLFLITTESSPQQKRKELAADLTATIIAGEHKVEGASMIHQLAQYNFQSIYSAAGPKILHMLIDGQQLNRLYLTFAHQLLATTEFSTILEGKPVAHPPHLQLNSLYLDPTPFDQAGQLFASYNLTYPTKR